LSEGQRCQNFVSEQVFVLFFPLPQNFHLLCFLWVNHYSPGLSLFQLLLVSLLVEPVLALLFDLPSAFVLLFALFFLVLRV